MKKLILTLALVGVSAVAFGQGQITIENFNHPVQFTTDTSALLEADLSLAGQAVFVGTATASGKDIVVGLYAGATSGSLTLLTTLPLSQDTASVQDGSISSAGFVMQTGAPYNSPISLPGNVLTYFIFAAWDGAFATEALARDGGSYYGHSAVFTMVPAGPSPALPNSIETSTDWVGPINIGVAVPEPGTFALAGLGAAALLIFRRRN
jgi:hypothetical protein